jgi:hypothetical protein
MNVAEVELYDWDRLTFMGIWPDEKGRAEYWFESPNSDFFWGHSLSWGT